VKTLWLTLALLAITAAAYAQVGQIGPPTLFVRFITSSSSVSGCRTAFNANSLNVFNANSLNGMSLC